MKFEYGVLKNSNGIAGRHDGGKEREETIIRFETSNLAEHSSPGPETSAPRCPIVNPLSARMQLGCHLTAVGAHNFVVSIAEPGSERVDCIDSRRSCLRRSADKVRPSLVLGAVARVPPGTILRTVDMSMRR